MLPGSGGEHSTKYTSARAAVFWGTVTSRLGALSLSQGQDFPRQPLVSPGLSQHTENNTSWLGYRVGGQRGSEFFEISKYLQKIILVGRCEKSLNGGTFPADLKLEFFKGN